MIFKMISSLIQNGNQSATLQGEAEERKVRKDSKLIDVAHEAMREHAAEDHMTLESLIRMGWPHVIREKFRRKVRRKVWDVVKEDFGTTDEDMVDEVTEKIVETAEVDPYYKKMFGK